MRDFYLRWKDKKLIIFLENSFRVIGILKKVLCFTNGEKASLMLEMETEYSPVQYVMVDKILTFWEKEEKKTEDVSNNMQIETKD